MKEKIYVIICSNRSKKIFSKNLDILKTSEIIFVKQNNLPAIYSKQKNIKEIIQSVKGVSRARNAAIETAPDDSILAFIDDDCVVDEKWIEEIEKFFKINKNIDWVFGKTLPYQPEKHKNEHCPCTFTKKSSETIKGVCKHWINVGFSNNMAIRSRVFKKIGGFKTWLGPGTRGKAAEDAEFILRGLIAGEKMGYNDKMVVYHNKWLNKEEQKNQYLIYKCGAIGAYGFYAFQGVKECWPVLKEEIKSGLKSCIEERKKIFKKLEYMTRGLILAFLFAKIVPMPKKEKVA